MEGSILALLEEHGSLAHEQIAAHLRKPPDAVGNTLLSLRDRGLVDVLSVGALEGGNHPRGLILEIDGTGARRIGAPS
jgi:DNA-binding transcriptional ArsR family regulator